MGGTKTFALALDSSGVPLASTRASTPTGSVRDFVAAAVSVVGTVSDDLGVATQDFAAVGVGVPGKVDPSGGTMSHAVNLGLGPRPIPLAALLSEALGAPVHVENDANAAALGTARLLPDAPEDLTFLSVGTGIAAGVVLGGRLRRGVHGVAGEIGHLPVDPGGETCECGRRGCLELVASGSAIARRWPVEDGRSPAEDVFRAAGNGHAAAAAIVAELGGHLAEAVILLAMTFDTGTVVLGGGVADVGQPLVDAVAAALRERAAASPLLEALHLDRSLLLAPDAPVGAIGAALAAHHELDGTARPQMLRSVTGG
ncbi:MAG TPA: ROK family protein [Acidimicrobiales bacterium]|nr:ROK family protein [Acidimicrobiales bacterium]